MTDYAKLLARTFSLDLTDAADRIVARLLADATDRRGWRQEWDQFDEEVQRAIVAKWRTVAREEIDGRSHPVV